MEIVTLDIEHDEDFWTEERTRQLQPMPLPTEDEDSDEPSGLDDVHTVQPSFTTSRVGHQLDKAPFRSCGLFTVGTFFNPGWAGSAFAIADDLIVTAGHCVYWPAESPSWYRNMVFWPQNWNNMFAWNYKIKKAWVPREWWDNTDFLYDFAVLKTETPMTNHPVETLDVAPSWDPTILPADLDAIGYPGEPVPGYDFGGHVMWQCAGSILSKTAGGRPRMASNYTRGSSGGPWVYYDSNTQKWVSAGLTSTGGDPATNRIASPPFGADLQRLIARAKVD